MYASEGIELLQREIAIYKEKIGYEEMRKKFKLKN
jgi:hypothetical protein